jgi:hypothetical protein
VAGVAGTGDDDWLEPLDDDAADEEDGAGEAPAEDEPAEEAPAEDEPPAEEAPAEDEPAAELEAEDDVVGEPAVVAGLAGVAAEDVGASGEASASGDGAAGPAAGRPSTPITTTGPPSAPDDSEVDRAGFDGAGFDDEESSTTDREPPSPRETTGNASTTPVTAVVTNPATRRRPIRTRRSARSRWPQKVNAPATRADSEGLVGRWCTRHLPGRRITVCYRLETNGARKVTVSPCDEIHGARRQAAVGVCGGRSQPRSRHHGRMSSIRHPRGARRR